MKKNIDLFVGNEFVTNIISDNFISNKLSNSNILYGNKGLGKSTFIYNLAIKFFDKLDNTKNNSNLIFNNSHPNFKLIDIQFNEKTKKFYNQINIDQIRSLDNFINYSSLNNYPKIVLIDNADLLNINSSNALLKILEEPKTNVYFFLIAHKLSSLIPTIKSRCIKFYFNNLSLDDFKKIVLMQNSEIPDESLDFLYDITNGSPGVSVELFYEKIIDEYNNIIEIYKENIPISNKISDFSDYISKKTNQQFEFFIMVVKFILINLLKINYSNNLNNNFQSDILNNLYELAKKMDINKCINTIDYIDHNLNDLYRYNLDKKFFTYNLFSSINK